MIIPCPVVVRFWIMSQSSKGGVKDEWTWYHGRGGCDGS